MPLKAVPRSLLAIAAWAWLSAAPAPAASPPEPDRRAELRHMVRHECGACHGIRLEGGLGPALTPERLGGRSTEVLVRTILEGREGTPMPPWRPFLGPGEARWLVERLKQGDLHGERG